MKISKKILFVAVSLALQGCSDPAERSAEYVESGKTFFEKENFGKAKLEFRNALQIDNKLGDAYYYLALINEKDKDWKAMYGNLTQTISVNPQNKDARIKLGKLYLLSGNAQEAQTEVDWLVNNSIDDPDVITLKGALFLRQGNIPEALEEAKKALAIDPGHLDGVGLLVGVYMAEQNFKAAEDEINKALALKPDELALNLLRLQLHAKSKNDLLLEQDYKNLINLFPDKHDFSYALAKFYLGTKRESEALAVLENLIKQNPTNLKSKLALVEFLMLKDKEKAEITLKQYVAEDSTNSDLYLKLANLYIVQKKQSEAKEALNSVIKLNGDDKNGLIAKNVLGQLALKENDRDTALSLTQQVLTVDSRNYDALILQARINIVNGSYDDAITNLRGVLRDYADSDDAMVLLGQAFIKKNSPELASENFRKAIEINPANFSAVMPVVSQMVKSNDIIRAEELLQNALKVNSNHPGALQALAQVRLLKKDWLGTQKVADIISSKPKGQGFSNYLSGKISQGQNQCEQAVEKYKLALSFSPSLSDALKSIMACNEKLNLRADTYAYLDEFIQKNASVPYPYLFKSALFNLDKQTDKAIAVLNEGISKWPKTYQFYEAKAKIYEITNDKEKAILIYNQGLEVIPDNGNLRMLLAFAYEQQLDFESAIKHYEMTIEKYPNADVAVNNLVSILLDHFPSKDNFERAAKLAQRFESSTQPYYLDSYGWATLNNGSVEEAMNVLKKVATKNPEVAVFQYHFGVAQHKAGYKIGAIESLERALSSKMAVEGKFLEKDKAEVLLKKMKETME